MEAVNSYVQILERQMDCPKGIRRPFLKRTRQEAEQFLQDRPDATRQELTDYLGEPQELAQGFLETLDPDVLERYHRRKKVLLRGCIAVLAAALAAAIVWGLRLRNTQNIEIIETTTIIYHDSQSGEETQ